MIFYCEHCGFEFENQAPSKKEYSDPLFGACWKYISACPKCNAECSEKKHHKPQKKSNMPPLLFNQGGCNPGAGCCG